MSRTPIWVNSLAGSKVPLWVISIGLYEKRVWR